MLVSPKQFFGYENKNWECFVWECFVGECLVWKRAIRMLFLDILNFVHAAELPPEDFCSCPSNNAEKQFRSTFKCKKFSCGFQLKKRKESVLNRVQKLYVLNEQQANIIEISFHKRASRFHLVCSLNLKLQTTELQLSSSYEETIQHSLQRAILVIY